MTTEATPMPCKHVSVTDQEQFIYGPHATCADCDEALAVITAAEHDRLVTENQNLRTDKDELSDSRDDFMAQVDDLTAMARKARTVAELAYEMLEWAGMEHTDTCSLYQENPSDEASCDCLLGDMRQSIAKYEEARGEPSMRPRSRA